MTPRPSQQVRAEFRAAAEAFVAVVARVAADDWCRPGLGVWNVRDLVGHTSRALLTVESYLDPTRTLEDPDLADAVVYYRAALAALADPDAVALRGRQAGAALGDDPAAAVRDHLERVRLLVDDQPDNARLDTPVGSMRLIDYLPSRTFELVVHGLDLVTAIGDDPPTRLTELAAGRLDLVIGLAVAAGRAPDVLLTLTGRRPWPDGVTVL